MPAKIISVPFHIDDGNYLVVLEEKKDIPFVLSRVFFVRAGKGIVRGKHAHKKCSQLMTCVSGSVEIFCDDGVKKKTFFLDNPSIGLIVKPGVWAQQLYLQDDTVLSVFCDRPFEKEDYIHDYDEFKLFIE